MQWTQNVSPRKGRWIEISKLRHTLSVAPVSPRKGRWIEIVKILSIMAVFSVSPRKGRWIEIKLNFIAFLWWGFLPVRGDGLKF